MSLVAHSRTPPAIPGIDHLDPPAWRFIWAVSITIFTVSGVFRFTYKYFDDVARGAPGTIVHRAIEEATGAYAAALLFVAVVAFVWRYPLDRPGWRDRIPIHLVGLIAYSAAHTTLMFASRTAIFAMTGMGSYVGMCAPTAEIVRDPYVEAPSERDPCPTDRADRRRPSA